MVISTKTRVIAIGIIVLSSLIFVYLKPSTKCSTFYYVYQIDHKRKSLRKKMYVYDQLNFTVVSYSGNGWQKFDSTVYQKKGNHTLVRGFLARYDENTWQFNGFQFDATESYRDYSDSLTVKAVLYVHENFPKCIEVCDLSR